MDEINKNSELIQKKTCSICGKKLQLEHPLKDANGNFFCPDDYKVYALAEGKKEQKNILFD